ncbi:Uncharacterised protein [uncultured archaeon]|nr:Uncharacterised protein [uncultured archaeon]
MGPPMFEGMMGNGFGLEVLYSFVIILVSLMIYFSTKELYELSSYKGIKYFRLSFLFFAIAYFVRSFIKFVMFYFSLGDVRSFHQDIFFGLITLALFSYFSSMAIFYLVESVLYKKFNGKMLYVFHVVAIIIAFSVLFFISPRVILTINVLLLASVFTAYYFSRKEKGKNSLSVIYGLLALFFTANFIDTILPDLFRGLQLWIYLVSISIFLTILYKVLRKVGAS